MRLRRASVALVVGLAVVAGAAWLVRSADERAVASHTSVKGPEPGADQALVSAPGPAPSSGPPEESLRTHVSKRSPEGELEVPAEGLPQPAPDAWETIAAEAKSSRGAARSLDYLSTLCQVLRGMRADSERFNDPRWLAIAKRCPSRLPDITEILATSIPPSSQAITDLRHAMEAGDAARKDAFAESLLRTSHDPDELESAAGTYFDAERLRALAGDDRPTSLDLNSGALALQIDLVLLVSCALGTDCAPSTPMTLAQCATTSLCYPGQTMQQIIALRRSPEEMAYLQRVLAYVHRMRKPGH